MLLLIILVTIVTAVNNVQSTTQIPETTNALLSLINGTLTWNEASAECQTRGGRLINIYDEIRKIALTIYVKYLTNASYLSSEFWIGLHDVSNGDGIFKWSDCSDISTSYWSNKTQDIGEYCVSGSNDDLSWRIRPCSDQLPAICETTHPCSCTLELKTNECANLGITMSVEFPGISEEACKIKCLVHARSNEQCWALTFNKLTGTCIIHERLQLQTTCRPSLRFYTKVCFTYISPVSPINKYYINNTDIPDSTCNKEDSVIVTADNCNYTVPSTIPTTEALCTCCSSGESGLPEFWGNSTLKQQIDWLVTSIKVDKHNTSVMRRRKFSAVDSRITATSIGYVGAAILILLVSGIVILDLNRFRNDVQRAFKGLHLYIRK